MPSITVEITRFVDAHQPGWVECNFIDANGERHTFVEKVPVVTAEDLCSNSTYPRHGCVDCEIQNEWQDINGRQLCQITTAHPWGVESETGFDVFVVLQAQLQRAVAAQPGIQADAASPRRLT